MVQNANNCVVHSEHALEFVGSLNLGIITDELAHSSPKSGVICQGIDKLLGGLHEVDIRYQGVFASKMLYTRVNCCSIRKDGICGYSVISSRNVESWEPRFMFSDGKSGRCKCPLSGIFKSFLYGFSIN